MTPHQIPELEATGLRQFGLTTGSIVPVLFGLVLPWLFDLNYPLWPWFVGGLLIIWALMHSPSLNPVYRGWMCFGLLLSRITTPLVLGLVFFLVITPMSLGMRLFGRTNMSTKQDPKRRSYRELSDPQSSKHMEKPF